MRKLSSLILGFGLMLIVFCLSLGLFSAQRGSYEVLSVNNLSVLNSIAVGYPSPAENATLDVANWSRMQGIRVHTLIVDGNVGIGTIDTSEKITINASDHASTSLFFSEAGLTNYGGLLTYDANADVFKMVTREGGVEKLGIVIGRTTGNVGIGRLPANTAKLAVDVNRTISTNNPDANIIASFQNSQTPLNNNDTRIFDITQTASNNVVLRGVGRDVIIIGQNISLQPTGNVGIGTTAPRGRLDVNGRIFFAGGFTPIGSLTNEAFQSSDAAFIIPTYTGTETSDLRLYIMDNSDDRFSIWGNTCAQGQCGNLTKAVEAHRFDAAGNVYHGGNVNITGNVTAKQFTPTDTVTVLASCSQSEWGTIKKCTQQVGKPTGGTETYYYLCVCVGESDWKWRIIYTY